MVPHRNILTSLGKKTWGGNIFFITTPMGWQNFWTWGGKNYACHPICHPIFWPKNMGWQTFWTWGGMGWQIFLTWGGMGWQIFLTWGGNFLTWGGNGVATFFFIFRPHASFYKPLLHLGYQCLKTYQL